MNADEEPTVINLPSRRSALRTLRAELEQLATAAAAADIRTRPIRVEKWGRFPNEYDVEFWHDSEDFKVVTTDGSVCVAGGRKFDWWPDIHALENDEVRSIANAMLSALNHLNKQEMSEQPSKGER